jgi:alpha-tubulin suppressor-like RCC1 family protein
MKIFTQHLLIIVAVLNFVQKPLNCSAQTLSISAGGGNSIFLCSSNNPMACGGNSNGQLGDGTTTNRNNSVKINSLNGIIAVSGGLYHSLFLKNDNTVWASGWNNFGQLGDGTTTQKNTPVIVNNLTGIIAIAAGDWLSYFLKNDGTVWACGRNNYSQLGDGTSIQRNTAIQISTLNNIIAIAAGGDYALFLKNDGTVWACGVNGSGQLGDGTTTDKSTPVKINSLTGIISISAGYDHSLFLKNDSTVWACGRNYNGQFGDGTKIDKSTPVIISAINGTKSIAAGKSFSLFLKNDGSVRTCGYNANGQLGDGTLAQKITPGIINNLTGISAITAGDSHSLFLKNDGTVWACGANQQGNLGDGTITDRSSPIQVNGLCSNPPVSHITASSDSIPGGTCINFFDSSTGGTPTSWSWTFNGATPQNSSLQIPSNICYASTGTFTVTLVVSNNNGSTSSTHSIFVKAPLPIKYQPISAGSTHSLFICEDNIPMSCGNNSAGQLGVNATFNIANNGTNMASPPVQVNLLNGIVATSAGNGHSLFLKNDRTVWGTGLGYGIGNSSGYYAIDTAKLIAINNISAIAAGDFHSLFLKSDGTAWACGDNTHSQLGLGSAFATPMKINFGSSVVKAISAGAYHSIFLLSDGTAWACGDNYFQQTGTGGSTTVPFDQVAINGIVTAISAGGFHSLFLKSDSTVWACGDNFNGQLGDGSQMTQMFPTLIQSLSGIKAIAAGGDSKNYGSSLAKVEGHSLFLKSDGTVWACGLNSSGQLGDGTTVNRLSPVKINGLSDIIYIAAGADHSFFMKSDSSIWACGDNSRGQLGDGTITQRNTPVQISGLIPSMTSSNNLTICSGNKVTIPLTSDVNATYTWLAADNQFTSGESTTIQKKSSIDEIITNNSISVQTVTYTATPTTACRVGAPQTITVTVYPLPVVSSTVIPSETVCTGTKLTLNGIGAFNYTWNNSVNNGIPFFSQDGSKVYTVIGTDAHGCSNSDSRTITVIPLQVNGFCQVTAINEITEQLSISIFPNPSNGVFLIKNQNGKMENVSIFNFLGENIYSAQTHSDKIEINLSKEAKGIYFLQILDETKKVLNKKIVIQ